MRNAVGRDTRGTGKLPFEVAAVQGVVDEDDRFYRRLPVEDSRQEVAEALQFVYTGTNAHQQDDSVHDG